MKKFYYVVAYVAFMVLSFGLILPQMISYPSSDIVCVGFAYIIIAVPFVSFKFFKHVSGWVNSNIEGSKNENI